MFSASNMKSTYEKITEKMTPYLTLWHMWTLGLFTLILFNLVAVFVVSECTCGKPFIPILLSRALTTDPWRGMTLAYSLLAIAGSFTFNSSILTTAFFGFFSAFLVSMFETSAHDFLIFTSASLVMYECRPRSWHQQYWVWHWLSVVVVGNIWTVWMVYGFFNYTDPEWNCSWFYILEYITFWLMNGLVLWIIPVGTFASDAICDKEQITQEKLISLIDQQINKKIERPIIAKIDITDSPDIMEKQTLINF